ncbi:sorting nexin-31 [Suncus etruscus]|uniref:sorting nexin-31 n=1 Tax=Suncus etruscus TaxID=109475 RepID=UPI002110DBEB|nr:sorting nexin-31 [Suncus etruscus]
MKLHFCIPVTQQLPDALGGRYVLYSVYLDGFLLCRLRYSQLHSWNQQLKRVFGNYLPRFPPKYYLAMTTAMADARRDQLEQYLQNVAMDPGVLKSDIFIDFWKLVQLETFRIKPEQASLDVLLPSGKSVKVAVLTSDTAERVLEVLSHKMGFCAELLDYFGLFLIGFRQDGELSVLKKLANFELPFVSLRSAEAENCRVGLRKWYLDPALDSRLTDCSATLGLLYSQAVWDMEQEWATLSSVQRQELEAHQKEDQPRKFLEQARGFPNYGHLRLDPCTCDFPEPGCAAEPEVGSGALHCQVTLPDGQKQDFTFQMSSVRCWRVTFRGALLGKDQSERTLQNLELQLQCLEGGCWRWFVIYTKQAFLLSNCLQKMISEKVAMLAAGDLEMVRLLVPLRARSGLSRSAGACLERAREYCPGLLAPSPAWRGRASAAAAWGRSGPEEAALVSVVSPLRCCRRHSCHCHPAEPRYLPRGQWARTGDRGAIEGPCVSRAPGRACSPRRPVQDRLGRAPEVGRGLSSGAPCQAPFAEGGFPPSGRTPT